MGASDSLGCCVCHARPPARPLPPPLPLASAPDRPRRRSSDDSRRLGRVPMQRTHCTSNFLHTQVASLGATALFSHPTDDTASTDWQQQQQQKFLFMRGPPHPALRRAARTFVACSSRVVRCAVRPPKHSAMQCALCSLSFLSLSPFSLSLSRTRGAGPLEHLKRRTMCTPDQAALELQHGAAGPPAWVSQAGVAYPRPCQLGRAQLSGRAAVSVLVLDNSLRPNLLPLLSSAPHR